MEAIKHFLLSNDAKWRHACSQKRTVGPQRSNLNRRHDNAEMICDVICMESRSTRDRVGIFVQVTSARSMDCGDIHSGGKAALSNNRLFHMFLQKVSGRGSKNYLLK